MKYTVAPHNERLGTAVMRQKSDTENAQLAVVVILPKEVAQKLAYQIADWLRAEDKG